MKADRNDAPEWLTSKPRKRGNMGAVVAGAIGVVVTLGALTLGGQAFMKNTVKNLAANSQQPRPKPVAEITQSEPAPRNDWDKIVEEQARRDAMSRQQQPELQTGLKTTVPKQTVFNDQNYTPEGRDKPCRRERVGHRRAIRANPKAPGRIEDHGDR
ncbi:hypothetical protein [Ectopseudomonas mendocina]|uniref:hypothetical protein n=1 Tax=Ectopseudomonas mendocina TaxID=300 RepID=UPI00376EFBA1